MKVAPWFRLSITVLAVVVLGGCGASGTPSLVPGTVAPPSVGPTVAAPTAAATLPTPSPRTSTDVFDPHFKFTLPATWTVTDEKVVLIRFLPNGATNDDFDNGQTDGIDVIDGIGASTADCGGDFAPKIGFDAASIATELANRPGLKVTKSKTSVGGLSGFVLDVRLAPGWSKTCPGAGTGPVVPLIHSGDGYDQMIGTGTFMRLYFLAVPVAVGAPADTVAIEVVDQSGGSHIASLTAIVKSFVFLPSP